MISATRRTAVIGTSVALASAGLLGTAVAGPHAHANLKTTTLTIHAPATTTAHYKATVGGKLRSHKSPLAGEDVSLQQRSGKGKTWTDTGSSQTTGTDGKVSFTFTQSEKKEQYRLFFAGDSTYKKTHSGTVTIKRAKPAPTPTETPTSSS